jgi:hypothetical protein
MKNTLLLVGFAVVLATSYGMTQDRQHRDD